MVARDHPLARLPAPDLTDLASHRQLVIASRTGSAQGQALGARFWRLNSFYSMAELATRGLGWALVPQHIASYPPFRDHLTVLAGEALGVAPRIEVEMIARRDGAQGPVARWLRRSLGQGFRGREER